MCIYRLTKYFRCGFALSSLIWFTWAWIFTWWPGGSQVSNDVLYLCGNSEAGALPELSPELNVFQSNKSNQVRCRYGFWLFRSNRTHFWFRTNISFSSWSEKVLYGGTARKVKKLLTSIFPHQTCLAWQQRAISGKKHHFIHRIITYCIIRHKITVYFWKEKINEGHENKNI